MAGCPLFRRLVSRLRQVCLEQLEQLARRRRQGLRRTGPFLRRLAQQRPHGLGLQARKLPQGFRQRGIPFFQQTVAPVLQQMQAALLLPLGLGIRPHHRQQRGQVQIAQLLGQKLGFPLAGHMRANALDLANQHPQRFFHRQLANPVLAQAGQLGGQFENGLGLPFPGRFAGRQRLLCFQI